MRGHPVLRRGLGVPPPRAPHVTALCPAAGPACAALYLSGAAEAGGVLGLGLCAALLPGRPAEAGLWLAWGGGLGGARGAGGALVY